METVNFHPFRYILKLGIHPNFAQHIQIIQKQPFSYF